MINKPYKLFIGKDIGRTLAIAAGVGIDVVSANIVEGEVVLLDKNMEVLGTNATYSDSNAICIAEGTSRVINYSNSAGTALTGRHILLSDVIEGNKIRKVTIRPFTAKAEAVTTISDITGTITAGTEYVLKIVYKDVEEHPGQFTQTYRYFAKAGDTSVNIFNGLRLRIAKHTGSRVIASGTTTLVLTAKPIAEVTSNLQSIDDFKMVKFEAFLNFVDNDGIWAETGATVTNTPPVYGSGNWEQIRDMEKFELGYRGVTNRTLFPVIQPDIRTEKRAMYDVIVIEYDTAYRSPDNGYEKETSKRAILALDSNGGQTALITSSLRNWVNSIPQLASAV